MFNTGLGSFGEPEDFAGRVYTAPGTNTTQVPAGNQQQVGGLTPAQQAHQNEDLAIVPNGNDKPVVGGTVPVGGGITPLPPSTTTPPPDTPPPDTSQVDALNAQIAELQGQLDTVNADLVSANDRFNTAQTEFDQTLADQETQFLSDQEAALTAQKETMLAERAGLLEGQQTQFDEAKAGWTAEKETAVQEAVARVQAEAEANLANLEAQMQEQINAKMSEIDQLQQTLTDVQKQVAEAKAEADGYKSQVRSQFDQSVYDEADKRYRGLLDEEQGVLEQLRQKEAEHDVLINEAATTFDDAVNASMNRIQDYDLVVRGGILDDAVNTYTAPTDIAAQHAELATAAGQVGDQAQTLANTQGNIFSQLVSTGGGGGTGGGGTGGEDVDPATAAGTVDTSASGMLSNPTGAYTYPGGIPFTPAYGVGDVWKDAGIQSGGQPVNWDVVGGTLTSALNWLGGKAKDAKDLFIAGMRFHPLYGWLMPKGGEKSAPALTQPELDALLDQYSTYTPQDPTGMYRTADEQVEDALNVDSEGLIDDLDPENYRLFDEEYETYDSEEERDRLLALQKREEQANKYYQAGMGRDELGTRIGAMSGPGSGYSIRGDIGSGAGSLSMRGAGGSYLGPGGTFFPDRISGSGRLPTAGGSWGGLNPFAETPQPGDPMYADFLMDTMGPDKNLDKEIQAMVERDMSFVQVVDENGDGYLIDKETGAVIAGPFAVDEESGGGGTSPGGSM